MTLSAPPAASRTREILFGILKLGAAVVLTWLVLRKIDFARAFAIAAALSPGIGIAAMGLLVIQALLSAWRWALISRRTQTQLPFGAALRLFMISLFYNQALPSTVPGDAARVWGAARFGTAHEATVGVFLDRLLTLLALLLLTGLSLGALALRNQGSLVTLAPALVLASAFAALALLVILRERLVSLLPGRAGDFAVKMGDAIHRLFASTDIVSMVAISLFIHGLGIAAIYVLAQGMGLALDPVAAFIAVPLVLLAALLPISVNGWGVREGAMVAVLAGFGIGRTEAATLSVIFGLFQLVLGLSGGFFTWFPERGGRAKGTRNAPVS